MRSIVRHCAALAILALALAPAAAHGQLQPAPTAKAAGSQLTLDDLRKMLVHMGYDDIKDYKDSKGQLTSFTVKIQSGTWTFPINFSLSRSKMFIWLSTGLLAVEKPESIPPKALMGLLNANRSAWPTYFYFDERGNRFQVSSNILNVDVKPGVLRGNLERYLEAIKGHEKYWNPKKWN